MSSNSKKCNVPTERLHRFRVPGSEYEFIDLPDEMPQPATDLAQVEHIVGLLKAMFESESWPTDNDEQAAQLLDMISYVRQAISIFLRNSYIYVQPVPEIRVPYRADACATRADWLRYCQSWCTSVRLLTGCDFQSEAASVMEPVQPSRWDDIIGGDIIATALALVSKMQQGELRRGDKLVIKMQGMLSSILRTEEAHVHYGDRWAKDMKWRFSAPSAEEVLMNQKQQEDIVKVTQVAMKLVEVTRRFHNLMSDYLKEHYGG